MNNFYDLIRKGVEAKKKIAADKVAMEEFLTGRVKEAVGEFDRTIATVEIAVENCAKMAEEFDDFIYREVRGYGVCGG